MQGVSRRLVVAVMAAVAVAVYVLLMLLLPETLDETARRLHGCIEQSDAGCLISHVHRREKSELGLDEDKLQKLLSVTTDRVLAGGSPGQLTVNIQSEQAMATAQRDYAGANGVRVGIGLTVQIGDDGTTCSPIVWQLVREYALAKALERAKSRSQLPAAFASVLRESRSEFERAGLEGVVVPGTDGKLQSWDTLIQHWEGVAMGSKGRS